MLYFKLLMRENPFPGADDGESREFIKTVNEMTQDLSFIDDLVEQKKISAEASVLLKGMLCHDPQARWSAKETLRKMGIPLLFQPKVKQKVVYRLRFVTDRLVKRDRGQSFNAQGQPIQGQIQRPMQPLAYNESEYRIEYPVYDCGFTRFFREKQNKAEKEKLKGKQSRVAPKHSGQEATYELPIQFS